MELIGHHAAAVHDVHLDLGLVCSPLSRPTTVPRPGGCSRLSLRDHLRRRLRQVRSCTVGHDSPTAAPHTHTRSLISWTHRSISRGASGQALSESLHVGTQRGRVKRLTLSHSSIDPHRTTLPRRCGSKITLLFINRLDTQDRKRLFRLFSLRRRRLFSLRYLNDVDPNRSPRAQDTHIGRFSTTRPRDHLCLQTV